MTVSQAAELFGYSRRTLLDAIERGALPATRMGKRAFLVEEKDVAAYKKRTGGLPGRPTGSKDSQPSAKRHQPRKPMPEGEGQS